MKYGPIFAHLFHIRPWEIGYLTVAEFAAFQRWADEYMRRMKEKG